MAARGVTATKGGRLTTDAAERAAERAAEYAVASALVASPHEVDVLALLNDHRSDPADVTHSTQFEPVRRNLASLSLAQLQTQYSSLFEVGDAGPPVPIRESLRPDRGKGALEEISRFYEHFGYAPDERWAWQPDHLSIELEFMHLLCVREAQAPDEAIAAPYRRAQLDFTQRHFGAWVPRLASDVATHAPHSIYRDVLAAVRDFVSADRAWQASSSARREC